VRWALVNLKTNEWLSALEVVEVAKVVTVIPAGDSVWSLFTLRRKAIPGTKKRLLRTPAAATGSVRAFRTDTSRDASTTCRAFSRMPDRATGDPVR
jgi:hypothetical protein